VWEIISNLTERIVDNDGALMENDGNMMGNAGTYGK